MAKAYVFANIGGDIIRAESTPSVNEDLRHDNYQRPSADMQGPDVTPDAPTI